VLIITNRICLSHKCCQVICCVAWDFRDAYDE